MHRFFIGPQQLTGQTARITGEDMAHMSRVLRLRAGDLVTLCDGAGMDYEARLRSLGKEEILLDVLSSRPSRGEPAHRVTLYQGLPKAGKMELILQKSVELGLYSLVPVLAQRSVVKLTPKEFEKKRAATSGSPMKRPSRPAGAWCPRYARWPPFPTLSWPGMTYC